MSLLKFKQGSIPYTLHRYFMNGGSLTDDEARESVAGKKIRNIVQRIADLQKKFDDAHIPSPLMVLDERNERGGTHARYFYRGTGCLHECNDAARAYRAY